MAFRLSGCILPQLNNARHVQKRLLCLPNCSCISYRAQHQNNTKTPETELFPARLILPEKHGYIPTLSPSDVNSILTTNETFLESKVSGHHVLKGFDSNQLASNYPVEDRRSQSQLVESPGTVFAVYDGHGGHQCAQALSERLFDYIAISLLPPDKLEKYSQTMRSESPLQLLNWHHNLTDYFTEDRKPLYKSSLQKYVIETLSMSDLFDDEQDFDVASALRSAFERLDTDISSEALPMGGSLNTDMFQLALSGACATVVYVDGVDISVASVGDTRAVLGQLTDDGEWVAKPLSTDHTFDNHDEVQRVRSSHPKSETSFVLKNNRLLGQLIPLRAFGDVRFKWSVKDLRNVVNIMDTAYASSIIPMNCYSPPYLIATPDITTHRLTANDKFLILATDGLWDCLTNDKAVQLIGNYVEGKQTVDNFSIPDANMSLRNINQLLHQRKQGLAMKSLDNFASTHLIRNALGPEHKKVSEMLTLPREISRYYRDDITVTVIFFDSNYICNNTEELNNL